MLIHLTPPTLFSDEEDEPLDIMMFLAISPDVDLPEDQPASGEDTTGSGDLLSAPFTGQKRSRAGQAVVGGAAAAPPVTDAPNGLDALGRGGPTPSASAPSFAIDLPDAPTDEVWLASSR